MKNSKLIGLLSSFTEDELNDFEDFVASPYFNKREDLLPFYQVLKGCAPTFPDYQLKKQDIFQQVFPGKPYDEKRFAYLMNYLLKLGERFLARKRYEKRMDAEELDILESFVQKGLSKHYTFLLNKIQQKYEQPLEKGTDYWFNRFRLASMRLEYFNSLKKRAMDSSFQDFSDTLDDFFMFEKLRHATSMVTLADLVSGELNLGFVDEINEKLNRNEVKDPQINMYQKLYLAYQDSNEQYFEEFLNLLKENAERSTTKVKRELYLFAINYCGRQLMKGKASYYDIVLSLYMEGVSNRALFEGEYLSPHTYINVVKLGLGLRRVEVVEEFINNFVDTLPPDKRNDAEYLSRAELLYFRKEYDDVLINLNKLTHTDIPYTLASRVLYLKAFYAQENIESLLSQITSFNQYLRRNEKISNSLKKPFANFNRCLGMIMRGKPSNFEKIKKSIEEMHPVAEKNWLLETLENELG